MPITSPADLSKQPTTHVAVGEISSDDIIRVIKAFHQEKPTRNVLWDFRNADPDSLLAYDRLEEVGAITKQLGALRGSGKTALVVSTEVGFGLARMYEAFAEIENLPHAVRAFRSMDQTLAWLG